MKNKERTDSQEEMVAIQDDGEPKKKKQKRFSVKEFRKSLKSENISESLKEFRELCFGSNKEHDYIVGYLDAGGSCLELLRLMELHTDVCHLILEIVYVILIKITSKYPQYTTSAQDACRYFLSTYITMANKMISLNSTRVERIAVLKFLTAVVALSPNFAKDILIHVNINPTNLGFLINGAYVVRCAFINFLMAFLIDGYYPTISALLEKRGLLTSIVKGLIHDKADTICVVINTLKTYVLENPLVSKTVKMRTFSTPVVKDIVQLYNWKGHVPKQNNSKEKKMAEVLVPVDPFLKAKVSDSVHDFLLILCTSHKYGVIFKDPQLGLGKKTLNSLIYTVLDSLDTPWKHSYASELVIKICGACPDLTKTVWVNLKPSLEPRRTEQWSSALRFTEKLLGELEPSRIEYAMGELTPHQLAQITQILIAPTQIIKTLVTVEALNDKYLKYNILQILTRSLESIEGFLRIAKNVTSGNFTLYKILIEEHLNRNFPISTVLLDNYEAKDDSVKDFDYLNVVFEILSIYQRISPQLLHFTNTSFDFKNILEYSRRISQDHGGLQIKIIKFYFDQDPALFLPNTEVMAQIMPYIVDYYCISQDDTAYEMLKKIFLMTEVFESCENEVEVWISSLANLNNSKESISDLFINVLRLTFEKSMLYFDQLSAIRTNLPENREDFDLKEQIQDLYSNSDTIKDLKPSPIKHTHLSPFLLALFEYLSNIDIDKGLKSYLNYAFINLLHAQTDPGLIFYVIQEYDCSFLNRNVLNYFNAWNDPDLEPNLSYSKGKLELLSKYSSNIIVGDVAAFLQQCNLEFAYDILNLLNMSTFYIANLAKQKKSSQKLLQNCLEYIKFCVRKGVSFNVLKHPVLHHYFSPLQIDKENSTHALVTNFLLEVIMVTEPNDVVLEQYKEKLYNSLCKMFRKAQKYRDFKPKGFMNIMSVVGLNTECLFESFEYLKEFDVQNSVTSDNTASIFIDIITYFLEMLNNLGKNSAKILEKDIIEAITSNILFLISKGEHLDINSLAKSFSVYLQQNPGCLGYISKELFTSIVQKEEYNRECVELSILLLKNRFDELFDDVMENIDRVTSKKGVILPVLDIVRSHNVNEDSLKIIYEKVEHVLHKSLQKPQKAGQHFEKYYKGINDLVDKFYSIEKYKNYCEKIHKFETTELFHVHILKTIFLKCINEDKKYTSNAIMTYVHLCMNFFKRKTKTDEDWVKFDFIIGIIKQFFESIQNDSNNDESQIQAVQNESFKMFCKFCLKFGLSGHPVLLSTLSVLIRGLKFNNEDIRGILEMAASHSEFLEWVLNEESDCKTEILNLMLELFKRSEDLMSKQYMPILLAGYRATLSKSDRIIFTMLKMFENLPSQTGFYDFVPFLWGKSAANHYSIRSDIQKALWRQPKIGSVLDILEEHRVLDTINKYPLNLRLDSGKIDLMDIEGKDIYDLAFLIPLFTSLLAPENAVQTYRFTKSGGLSLTIAALSSEDENTRNGACFVLSRFYHHVEARQTGKDNQLWLRFVEAISKGLPTINEEELKLNKFASVFLARMALILTQPTHIMYFPLSQYLLAKSTLDFSTIPELYIFLHSSDVNFKEHRSFILEVLRDGLVSSNDFHIALRSVSFKLIMEQYNSVLCDGESRLLILQVIERATRLREGCKLLCSNYGLMSWLCHVSLNMSKTDRKHILNLFNILYNVVSSKENCDIFVITLLLGDILDNISLYNLSDDLLLIFLKVAFVAFKATPNWLSENRARTLISIVDCKESKYFDQKDLFVQELKKYIS